MSLLTLSLGKVDSFLAGFEYTIVLDESYGCSLFGMDEMETDVIRYLIHILMRSAAITLDTYV